ncbi:glycosyltransferase [Flexibacterium corallicola]|uniref:glycosyltransferase n=1 Tax=Flexibacterium corallicola TaxID=3037259 RepID=UPI00286F7025|nr:glycosyltransferase [Pseudovibrio sp. M1P-2-3]
MADQDIAMCITSCGRLDLLAPTLDSFLPDHASHFSQMLVIDDANTVEIRDWLSQTYPKVETILNEAQLGQMKSIDKMYSKVEAPLIFHGEDDWLFEKGSTVESCLKVMEAEPKVSVVCVRKISDLQKRFQDNCIRKEIDGVRYALMPLDIHPEWLSFSFNPGMTRKSLWEQYGPYAQYDTEERISIVMKRDGWMVAFLDPGSCHHIGGGQHVHDPFQPKRASTFPERMKRSFMKRWRRLQRKMGQDI